MANYRSGRRSSGSAAASPVPSKSLAVTHLGQIEGYYCGPASGVMIMRYRQAGASALNGAALNQRNMASASHMETDAVGSTPFTSNNFRAGLNRWRGGTFFQTLANPTNAQFKDAFVTDIGAHSMPFGVSTVEFAGGLHYNFHPDRLIGHWIVGTGFENFADDGVRFVDPAANASGLSSAWDDVRERFESSAGTFNQRYVSYADHGIVW